VGRVTTSQEYEAVVETHVGLLRGINVGGRNRLPMKELAALFAAAGGRSVRTYIQSGNVLFAAGRGEASGVAKHVRLGIEERFGYRVPVVVRSASDFRRSFAQNPFLEEGASPQYLHLGFLQDAPSPQTIATLDHERSAVDSFVVRGREVYLFLPGGMARTKLTTAYFDRQLETVVTIRNWRTVSALIDLLA